ncbi:response regulator transcription factor [Marinospirillum sp.]|uniref:response regulator transcription factor n=1 Tax=Marinospirillum sp. TaxID=2183934 RepID=UPI00286FE28C|nr:response regulator transcription factor [Marinospirillum sp.]MDR9468586.1 response regulator transcription factor [Marinospirillum sp.]
MGHELIQQVMLVDSRPEPRGLLAKQLSLEGVQTDQARDAGEFLALWDYHRYDLVVLGELQDESSLVVLRKLRQRDDVPVFLIAESEESQRLAALEMGADDVLSQGCSQRELLLRIRNFLHRRLRQQNPGFKAKQKTWSFANWTLEEGTRLLVNQEGQTARLTRAEFDLLLALVRAGNRPLSKMQLSDAVGRGSLDTSPETIAVLIHRLRKKLGCKEVIQTLSGVGYRLPECELVT